MNFEQVLPEVQRPPFQEKDQIEPLLRNLESVLGKDDEQALELIERMDQIFREHGGEREADFNAYIHKIATAYPDSVPSEKSILVRREDPQRLFDSLTNEEPMKIDFRPDAHGGDPYPNSGILGWDGSGLRIPYQRGFGKIGDGKMVVVVGFVPNPEHLTAHPLPNDAYGHYTNQRERSMIRMVEGDVFPEDVRFVIMRFPKQYFPESALTEEELENEKVFHVSRVYAFNQKKKDQSLQ